MVVFYSGDLFSDFDLCICHQYFIQRPNLEMGKNTGGQLAVSGGKLWCSTLGTGRRTPSTPSSPSRLVPQIFSENQTLPLTLLTCLWPNCLMVVFITFNDEHDVSSQAGCCLYGCSTDGIASHHTWARWDNLNFMLFYDMHFCTYNLRTKFVIGWKSEELQMWAWSRPRHSSTFGHLRPFCLQVVEKI